MPLPVGGRGFFFFCPVWQVNEEVGQEVRQLSVHLSFDCYSGADGSTGFTLLPFATFPSLSALTGVLQGPPQQIFFFGGEGGGIIHVHSALGLRKGGHSVLCDYTCMLMKSAMATFGHRQVEVAY